MQGHYIALRNVSVPNDHSFQGQAPVLSLEGKSVNPPTCDTFVHFWLNHRYHVFYCTRRRVPQNKVGIVYPRKAVSSGDLSSLSVFLLLQASVYVKINGLLPFFKLSLGLPTKAVTLVKRTMVQILSHSEFHFVFVRDDITVTIFADNSSMLDAILVNPI